MQINVDNRTNFPVPVERFEAIARGLTQREIEVIVCDDKTIRELNAHYRGIDKATDVLSFPLDGAFPSQPLGSIVMSADRIRQIAQELGHSEEEESLLLFIHGILHLLGYDHEEDDGEMRELEERIIREHQLPESLIVRTEKKES
jgi:probable rRNA maturation factor